MGTTECPPLAWRILVAVNNRQRVAVLFQRFDQGAVVGSPDWVHPHSILDASRRSATATCILWLRSSKCIPSRGSRTGRSCWLPPSFYNVGPPTVFAAAQENEHVFCSWASTFHAIHPAIWTSFARFSWKCRHSDLFAMGSIRNSKPADSIKARPTCCWSTWIAVRCAPKVADLFLATPPCNFTCITPSSGRRRFFSDRDVCGRTAALYDSGPPRSSNKCSLASSKIETRIGFCRTRLLETWRKEFQ